MDKSEFDKMINGELYHASDPHLTKLRLRARQTVETFNAMPYENREGGLALLRGLFGQLGDNVSVKKPVYFDYGLNIRIGDNFYANYDTIFLDVAPITIGNNVMFGPRVSLYTAGHPIQASSRNNGQEFGLPITIGNNVWIGGNTVILPGITIGDDTVIGAGSIVTKNIPANVLAAGNPCRIIKKINS